MQNNLATVAPVSGFAAKFIARAKVAQRQVPALTAGSGSLVSGYAYIGTRQVLVVQLKGAKVYEYAKVTRKQFADFEAATSKGTHFNKFFLDTPLHPATKIADSYTA